MKLSTFFPSAQALKILGTLFLSSFILQPSSLSASPSPQLIPFQGTLLNPSGEAHANGQYAITFALYDAPVGGTPVWSERHEKVGVINGTVNVFLGSISPFLNTTWSNSVNFGTTKYLGITVDADGNPATADKEMAPRQIVLTSFYAPTTDKLQGYGWDMLFGSQNPSTSTIQLSKVPTLTLEATPQIPGSKLETDLVKNAIAASGQSVVNSGTIVMSPNANDTSLVSKGFTNLGSAQLGEGWKQRKSPVLSGRNLGACVWTGTEMIYWGGKTTESTVFADGAKYNPSTDTWTPMSSVNAPTGRYGISLAVWTGTEMVIWSGGETGGNITNNTGAAYNPTTDTWTILPASPIQGRFGCRAEYINNKIIYWGGVITPLGTQSFQGDGAILTKTGETWTWQLMPSLNAPSPRTIHSYVKAGDKLIVWGGVNSASTAVNTGAIYDVVSTNWTAINTIGAPSPRSDNFAAWTGTELLIWGGRDGSNNSLNNGGLYNPTTQTWRAIPTSLLSARWPVNSVTAGPELITWSGIANSAPYPNDGARYNFLNDTWQSISAIISPPSRWYMNPVWTGSEFLFFGGIGNGSVHYNECWSYTPPRTLYLYQKQ